jgi:hypothetical protein
MICRFRVAESGGAGTVSSFSRRGFYAVPVIYGDVIKAQWCVENLIVVEEAVDVRRRRGNPDRGAEKSWWGADWCCRLRRRPGQ